MSNEKGSNSQYHSFGYYFYEVFHADQLTNQSSRSDVKNSSSTYI